MVLHVSADNAKAASLGTLDELVLALSIVLHGIFVGANEIALRQAALEFETKEVLFNVPMEVLELDSIVTLTFLGTALIVGTPWLDASLAEEGLAAAALLRLPDDHGANGTEEEVSTLTLVFVLLDEILDVEVSFRLPAV